MALTLTHLRFAHGIMGLLRIEDPDAYYSGVVYPDSRMMTGVHRSQTHGDGNPVDPFVPGLTDFEKGWAAHEYYDRRSHPGYFRLSPWPVDLEDKLRRWWRYLTALKTIEDMQSFEAVGDVPFFRSMIAPPPPRGEDPALLERFYRLNIDLYVRRPTLEDYDRLRIACRISPEMANGVNEYTRLILQDKDKCQEISAIYPTILQDTPAWTQPVQSGRL